MHQCKDASIYLFEGNCVLYFAWSSYFNLHTIQVWLCRCRQLVKDLHTIDRTGLVFDCATAVAYGKSLRKQCITMSSCIEYNSVWCRSTIFTNWNESDVNCDYSGKMKSSRS